MSTGQTILTVGALAILVTIMLNFYRIFGSSWEILDGTQLGIDATTIATSYMEVAHGLVFDKAILDDDPLDNLPWDFTNPPELGAPDTINHISEFFVFDHFHGYRDTSIVHGVGTYVTEFEVYYVFPQDVEFKSMNETFAKRLDMKIWRIDPPPPPRSGVDTLQMWTVMGYYSYH